MSMLDGGVDSSAMDKPHVLHRWRLRFDSL